MLLLRANTLALGHSGCRPLLVDRICELLARGIHPVVPEQGSVGRVRRPRAARAPRAAVDRARRGRGRRPAGAVGDRRCATPAWSRSTLEPKEGLALLNGTQLMSALGALIAADADRLVRTASVAAAMSVEALLGTEVAFAPPYQLARPHPGQIAVAAELRHLLRGSGLQRAHHDSAHKVQDPYSLRCVPQVHGAVRDALDHLRRVLDIELNSATDNPLVFPGGGSVPVDALATGGGLVIWGGNFHGEPIALALDFAKLALAELGLDLRAADGAAARRPAQRRPAGVPVARSGLEQRPDDPPVHGGGPGVGEQGAGPSRRPPTRSRPRANQEDHVSMGADGRPARADRPRARRADPGASSCCARPRRWTCGSRCWRATDPARPLPGAGVAEAHAPGPRERSGPSARTASPAPTSRRRSRWSTTARWSTSPDRRRAVTVDSPPWRSGSWT